MRPPGFFANVRNGARGDPDEASQRGVFCFSMQAVTRNRAAALARGTPLVSERNLRFGAYTALVRDPSVLHHRIESALTSAGLDGYQSGLVSYASDELRDGHPGLFEKSDAFAYQCEFRIAARTRIEVPALRFSVGSLEDICDVFPTAELNRFPHVGRRLRLV